MAFSRRVFLKGVSAAGLSVAGGPTLGSPGDRAKGVSVFMSPEVFTAPHPLTPVPIEQVVIDDEFWTPKRNIWRTVTLKDCFDKFEKDRGDAMINFDRVRDGLKGGHAGPPWTDGLIYEMIRGAADFLRSHRDPELEARLDRIIERIVLAADKDPGGYVNTFTQLEEPDHRWGLNGGLEVWQHEFYNLGALVDAGVHYYRATGKTMLLKAGVKVADTMAELVGIEPGKNLVPSHELPEEAMLGLHQLLIEHPELGGNADRYLKLAEFWIENRGRHGGMPDWDNDRGKAEQFVRSYHNYADGRPSWGDYAQDHRSVFEEKAIVGHAVRATLLWSAVAATARVNQREEYRKSALRLWESMTLRRMHVTGGVGAYANEEKFGPDYALPNDAYLETCAAVGAGFFHQNMNLLFGHARYADELERALYNGVLCGVSISGDRYTYQNPLQFDERHERWSWHDCPCCPPMFLKSMGALPGYIYATDADAAYMNLYVGGQGSMKVKGTELVLRQSTKYPWEGEVRIAVEPSVPTEFGLMLRIPAWCQGASMKVNGRNVSTENRVRGYVRIDRKWEKGDVVELKLPMPVVAMRAHPKVLDNVGRVALMRGPIVYSVESVDLDGPWELPTFAAKPEFETEAWPDRLGGVVVVKASANNEPASGWSGGLYDANPQTSTSLRRIIAIPFYANANRGPAHMAVWIPRET